MIPVLAASVFLLLAAGVYLVLQTSLLRVALGLALVSHSVHLILLTSGRRGAVAPVLLPGAGTEGVTDPLPQAFVLTAIVIAMAMTVYLFAALAALAKRGERMEVEPVPDSDEARAPETVRAELEGKVTGP
ncbi:MAG: sodium:proton antiporter [Gemmatimonadota bacterium]|jgi:multicomponent Na+:H+ antiporter subunit C